MVPVPGTPHETGSPPRRESSPPHSPSHPLHSPLDPPRVRAWGSPTSLLPPTPGVCLPRPPGRPGSDGPFPAPARSGFSYLPQLEMRRASGPIPSPRSPAPGGGRSRRAARSLPPAPGSSSHLPAATGRPAGTPALPGVEAFHFRCTLPDFRDTGGADCALCRRLST